DIIHTPTDPNYLMPLEFSATVLAGKRTTILVLKCWKSLNWRSASTASTSSRTPPSSLRRFVRFAVFKSCWACGVKLGGGMPCDRLPLIDGFLPSMLFHSKRTCDGKSSYPGGPSYMTVAMKSNFR